MRTAIALGTNQGDLLAQLQKARDLLLPFHEGAREDFLQSPVYKTSPVGCPAGSPDFYNAVLSLEWGGSPRSLLNLNKDIEYLFGRDLGAVRNAPRPMDLDILLMGDCEVDEWDLVIPHPRLAERLFVLYPLADIMPEFVVPGTGKTVKQLLSDCSDKSSVPVVVTENW